MEKHINDELKDTKKVKLSDISTRVMDKNKDNSIYTYLTISAQLGLVDQAEYFDRQIGSKDSSNYYILKKGEFAYNKSYSNGYPYGAIKQLENYDNGILSPLYICFKLDEHKVNPEYIKQFFESSVWHRYIDSICTEGARNHGILNIAVGDFFDMPLNLPPMEMQIKYGKLLSSIDDLIEQSSSLENLYTLTKKNYMQQIFNDKLRTTNCVVEVQWEENTLDNVFETITDYVAAGSFADVKKNVTYRSDPDYAMLVRCTDLKSKFSYKDFVYVDKHAFDFLHRVNIDDDCIVLPNIGNIGESYFCNKEVLPYKHNILGPNTIMVRSKKNNNKFLYYLTQAKQFNDELFKIAGGSSMLKFNKTDLKKIKVQIPIDILEQENIANLLSSIDDLIDFQNNITNEYKELKKYHLNNIFK